MATELGFLSVTHLQNLSQSQPNHQHHHTGRDLGGSGHSVWMWKSKQVQEEDDSWEVRAFAEDTGNEMGTTWPPRSYTCTFCGREFRSAQALGGHMNVHRRDRARIHHVQPAAGSSIKPNSSATSTPSSSPFVIPTQEFSTKCGLSLLYRLPNSTGVFTPTTVNAFANESPSTLLSISPCSHRGVAGQSINFPVKPPPEMNSSPRDSSELEPASSVDNSSNLTKINIGMKYKELQNEELDLELRLGRRLTTSSSSS